MDDKYNEQRTLDYHGPPETGQRANVASALVAALLCLPMLGSIVTIAVTIRLSPALDSVVPLFQLFGVLTPIAVIVSVLAYWKVTPKPWYAALCLTVNIGGLVVVALLIMCAPPM